MQDFKDHRLGFQSVLRESPSTELLINGKIPSWLNGELIRNGPAKYSIANESLNHWFDGYSMLHRFSFNQGKINYTSKFLQSDAYQKAIHNAKVSSEEFATSKDGSLFEKLMRPFTFKPTDNANVNIIPWGNECLAMTETSYPIIFERSTLKTSEHLNYQDNLSAQLITAHPHFDFIEKKIVNIGTKLGAKSEYLIFTMDAGHSPRKLVASIPVKKPGYLHSFAITQNYIVLVEFPLLVNPLDILFSGKPYIENYRWHKNTSSRVFLINKTSGKTIGPLEVDPFFSFHHVNAFENNKEIMVDLLIYPDSSIINSLYLSRLMTAQDKLQAPQFCRLKIDINKRTIKNERLVADNLELPRINYTQHNADRYQYAYGISQSDNSLYLNRLSKIDLLNNKVIYWQEDLCFAGEPVFVPAPEGKGEDSGIILSVVLDAKNKSSFIAILNAENMQEFARAILPNIMPFGFHGQFMESKYVKH